MSFSKPYANQIPHQQQLPSFNGCFNRKESIFGSVKRLAVSDSHRCSDLTTHLSRETMCSGTCKYCTTLAGLDMAAFYWSYMAMYGPTNNCERPVSPSPSMSSVSSTRSRSPAESLGSNGESQPPSPTSSVSSGEFRDATNNNGGKYQCRVCQKTYSHPRLLNRHVQSHTPYKKHHCPRCGKGFNDAFDLKRHIRTHTGVKPFKCSMCEKSFTQRCSLEAHATRVHGLSHEFAFRERRPKVYVCEECGITFQENSKFRKHAKDHHGKFEASLQ